MDRQADHARSRRSRLEPAYRSGRHPIRSTMLAVIAAVLATMLVLAASGNSALAASPLVNGNFETGDLTGWSANTADGGDATSSEYGVWFCSAAECWYPLFYTAHEGSYFAQLAPGRTSEDTRISQPFEASTGDRVSGWAFIHADELNGVSYSDSTGQVVIKSDSGETVATPFSRCAYGPYMVYQGFSSGWQYWEHTFTDVSGTGKFSIEARVRNTVDNPAPSIMGLDDVKTSTLAPDTAKPSTSASRSVEPNAQGWNKENVTVKLKATDNQGGWGVQKITYSASGAQTIAQTDVSGDSVDVKLDQEGTATITYYATDKAGNVEDKKTLTIKLDKTAPTVESRSPAENATRVSLSARIKATFLESGSGIDPSTLNASTFQVYKVTRSGNVPVSGTIRYDEFSKTVTFTPSRPLVKGTTYQATVYENWGTNPGVEDRADNKLYPSHTWRFSTGSTIYW